MRTTPLLAVLLFCQTVSAAPIAGRVVDAGSGEAIPARLYIRSASGEWFFPKSASPEGAALEYRREYPGAGGKPGPAEHHTALSAHPFTLDLPPGEYTLTAERGKEYLTATEKVTVTDQPVKVTLKLKRWIDMASRGWYSGDTHNHVPLTELPVRMLAEDLNVALPITSWVTDSAQSPREHNKVEGVTPPAKLIELDKTHVIWPVNTEYEIFTVGGKEHTLGAVILMNHREVFEPSTPPVGPIIEAARKQGALIDLDKHNWPWSMMLVPVAGADLFELSNNHVWRTNFSFGNWYAEYTADYMNLEHENGVLTERGWLEFGFQNYYTLLNCGYRLRPTAGTAAGVHPVPVGFGRVYVQLKEGFNYDRWVEGLNAGRSFVTTGPMLEVSLLGNEASQNLRVPRFVGVQIVAHSAHPITRIEVIRNGEIVEAIEPTPGKTAGGGYTHRSVTAVRVSDSSWFAVRCFEKTDDGRERFAHSAPIFAEVEGKPQRPRRAEVEYLVKRVEDEIARNRGVISPEGLAEFEKARDAYKALLDNAR